MRMPLTSLLIEDTKHAKTRRQNPVVRHEPFGVARKASKPGSWFLHPLKFLKNSIPYSAF
jgi:hypothetical protein